MTLKCVRMLQKNQGISERALAEQAGVSRETVRSALLADGNITIHNIEKISKALGRQPIFTLIVEQEVPSDDSIPVASLLISQDENWKIHLFNFVDAFRRDKDPRLVMLPPVSKTPLKYKALLASAVAQLCSELGLEIPRWALKTYFLPEPWFVAEVESLKAMAIQESPLFFRKNNIFVLDNFLSRA
jgi:transcriptional regulator with XRE-family HTH domain